MANLDFPEHNTQVLSTRSQWRSQTLLQWT